MKLCVIVPTLNEEKNIYKLRVIILIDITEKMYTDKINFNNVKLTAKFGNNIFLGENPLYSDLSINK